MAFITLIAIVVAISILRPQLPPRGSRPLIISAAIKEPACSSIAVGLMLALLAFFIPLFYAQTYVLNIGINENLAFCLLSIMNAADMIERLLPNALADKPVTFVLFPSWFTGLTMCRAGSLKVIILCALLSAITALVWATAKSSTSLIVIFVLYSFFSGGLMALPPAVIVTLSPSMTEFGTRIGMAFFFSSLGVLIGSPITGAILNAQSPRDGSSHLLPEKVFWGTFVFAGASLVLSGLLLTGTRFAKVVLRLVKA